jgi:trehalose 6-phosphate synthase
MEKPKTNVRPFSISRPIAVISNRAPYQLIKKPSGQLVSEKTVGGLVSVLDEVMCQAGGLWIAWGEKGDIAQGIGVPVGGPKYSLSLVSLTDQEVRNFYQGFSNRVLWPLSHYFLDRCHFRTEYWKSYRGVNEKFAASFREHFTGRELVWIHDFHLTLVPGLVRKERSDCSIGFFWHIPFPASPVFRVLPWREEVLRGLLGSDLIGFQLPVHAENFLQSVMDVIKVPVDRKTGCIRYEGRTVRVAAFPVGIDCRRWNEMASSPGATERAQQLRKELGVERLILGVDRLDYTKGILERLLAYEVFLEKYPEFHRKVCLMQIAVPSRTRVDEYRILRREIDEAIGRITGRFSTRRWIPLRYLYKAFPIEELVTYYLAADVSLITPLRDGMNLVAKEYIASKVDGSGSLILSEFAGASATLSNATLVNPYNIEELADAIRLSLSMPETERKARMQQLRQAVTEKDVYWWCESFLKSLVAGNQERNLDAKKYRPDKMVG